MLAILKRIDKRILIAIAVLAVIAVAVKVFSPTTETRTVTAHFPRAVSVYEGTDVRILGVTVGEVTRVTPAGNSVEVEMAYDATYDVPADASAVIVTPTLVADRFVQLTPVYEGGEVMADGAEIALPDTGIPVELDRIYGSLQALTRALGPNGVNSDGTLNKVLKAGRKALDGQGARGNEMVTQLAAAAETFGEGSGPLFETVTHLAEFTEVLANSDDLVRAFMTDLTAVSGVLAEESDELNKALKALAGAVSTVEGFVADNRERLVGDVEKLTDVMHTIASEEENLRTVLEVAPVALGNLQASFDSLSSSQNARFGVGGNLWSADAFLCGLVQQHPAMPAPLKDIACQLFAQLIAPITQQLGFIPPEYASYLPKQQTGQKAAGRPSDEQLGVYYTEESPSVASLLGGGS